MAVLKLIPQLCAWMALVMVLLRGFPGRRTIVVVAGCAGYGIGGLGAVAMFRALPVDIPLGAIRALLGAGFFLLWCVAVADLYRSTVRDFPVRWGGRLLAEGAALTRDLQTAIERSQRRDLQPPFLPAVAGVKQPFHVAVAQDPLDPQFRSYRAFNEMMHSGLLSAEQVRTIVVYRAAHYGASLDRHDDLLRSRHARGVWFSQSHQL